MEEKNPDRSQQHLANQRTFLAWLRTCMVLIGLGFVLAKFNVFLNEMGSIVIGSTYVQDSTDSLSSVLGIGIIVFGIALLMYALKNYMIGYTEISLGYHVPRNSIIYVSTIGVVAFAGVLVGYLALKII